MISIIIEFTLLEKEVKRNRCIHSYCKVAVPYVLQRKQRMIWYSKTTGDRAGPNLEMLFNPGPASREWTLGVL